MECERRLEFFQRTWLYVRISPPGWEARLYGRAETTPRPAHRVEGEAVDASAEGVIESLSETERK